MKKVNMIDAHADIQEVTVEKYVKYNMNGNEFNILMYDSPNGKRMSMVKEIYGALYTIPYQCDLTNAEVMEELDPDMVPSCILPAINYETGSKKLKSAIQKLIGTIAESKFQWYSHPEKYFLTNQEYKFPDSDKDKPKDIAYVGETSLPTIECDRYIAFKKSDESKSIEKYVYMPYRPADTAASIVNQDCHIMFNPAPSLNSIIPQQEIDQQIMEGVHNGYRTEVESTQIIADVKKGTTTVTPLIMPDGTTLSVQTLVLPSRHIYNVHFADDVNKLSEDAKDLGTSRFTVSPLEADGKSPAWLFKQGIARLRNVKVGGEYIVGRGDEYRYADYVEAAYHREHQKTRND